MTARLTDKPVWSFDVDGSVVDLGCPDPSAVCFLAIGNALSKLARFNGKHAGPAFSVAQHCVMGAQAVMNEGGTRLEAALFLLHDAHEWLLGDLTRPAADLYHAAGLDLYGEDRLLDTIAAVKGAWDEVIYDAAGLPSPVVWTRRQAALVKTMDERMGRAEAIALFGPRAGARFSKSDPPKTSGALRAWPAGIAEEQFRKLAISLIGEDRILEQAALSAAARALR